MQHMQQSRRVIPCRICLHCLAARWLLPLLLLLLAALAALVRRLALLAGIRSLLRLLLVLRPVGCTGWKGAKQWGMKALVVALSLGSACLFLSSQIPSCMLPAVPQPCVHCGQGCSGFLGDELAAVACKMETATAR